MNELTLGHDLTSSFHFKKNKWRWLCANLELIILWRSDSIIAPEGSFHKHIYPNATDRWFHVYSKSFNFRLQTISIESNHDRYINVSYIKAKVSWQCTHMFASVIERCSDDVCIPSEPPQQQKM